ncbi:MAG: hypothetical protein A2W11_11300 [Ignavibacteria bacterium RBG_16_35_7]|nr:MAG: hypothetical protein A2W11_11300 [Ignavibacteria bacterium RBG_16_35_7]
MSLIKLFLLIPVLLIGLSSSANAQWYSQTSGTTSRLSGVSFTDANNGTAVGEGGTILRTINGGMNWIPQTSGTSWWLHGVSFTDPDNGTAVGDLGTILKTTNGGTDWIFQQGVLPKSILSIHFTDENNGCAAGVAYIGGNYLSFFN